MEQDSSSISAELQALTSKRASLKDRLKKRREAMGNILEEATKDMAAIKSATKGQRAAEEEAKKLLSEVKKPKMEDTAQEKTQTTDAAQQGTYYRANLIYTHFTLRDKISYYCS